MTTTTNYGLKKPAQTDNYNVEDFNDNADKIDAALKDHADQLNNVFDKIFETVSVIST